MVIKSRTPIDWAEQQHFNYLMQVLNVISESEEDKENERHSEPMSDSEIIKSMGL